MTFTVSAPGKALIFGEYAVVGGGLALVAAVDRRVTVHRFEAPRAGYRVEGPIDGDDSLVRTVIRSAQRHLGRALDVTPAHLKSDVTQMFSDGGKLGLGSSAASAVALTGAVLGEAISASRDDMFQIASDAHHRWQGGRGSGAGLAAATWGNWQEYRLTAPDSPIADFLNTDGKRADGKAEPKAHRDYLKPPPGIRWELVALPEAANTRSFLDAVLDTGDRSPGDVRPLLGRLAEIANEARAAFRNDDGRAVVDLVRSADQTMEQLGERAGIPIATDTHRELRDAAARFDIAAKPSGAGGGDISLLAGPEGSERPAEPVE